MTEEPSLPSAPDQEDLPPAAVLPKWVPVAIGLVLVTMGGLAVFTGVRYRETPLARVAKAPVNAIRDLRQVAPPGEPEAGASLIFPGDGSNVPLARDPVTGRSRAEITGGQGNVAATVRIWARRGMILRINPDDAVIYVNDLAIGQAKQFDTPDEIYDFAQPGSYNVRVVAPGHRDRNYIVTAAENAPNDIAEITAKLEPGTVEQP